MTQDTREFFNHELLYCDTYDMFKFKLVIGVTNAIINHLCDVRTNFLSVMDRISTFEDTSAGCDFIINFLHGLKILARLLSLLMSI